MLFNFQKHPYRADCIQWTGINTQEILDKLAKVEVLRAEVFRKDFILIRFDECVHTLRHGDWIITGEDGVVRYYTNAKFLANYEPLAA